MALFDSNETIIATNDDFFGADPLIAGIALPATGTYFLMVEDFTDDGGASFFYTLKPESTEGHGWTA